MESHYVVALKQNLAKEGEAWPVAKSVEPGISGYSDLAVGPDGSACCFYERASAGTSHYRLQWLTDGRDQFA